MLAKKYRLQAQEVRQVIQKGSVLKGQYLCLFVKRSNTKNQRPRAAVVIPKAKEKTAVARHKIKRALFAFLGQYWLKPKNQNQLLVVRLERKILAGQNLLLTKELASLLKKKRLMMILNYWIWQIFANNSH